VGFLFRKYAQQAPDEDVSQEAAPSVESEEEPSFPPPELRWFPPSHKAQLILIAAGFVVVNVVLMAALAIALYLNLR
jgi:hypothetical protein